MQSLGSGSLLPNVRISTHQSFVVATARLCDAGVVIPEPVENLPVIMGEINVRVPIPNRKPWEPPYQLLPWRVAIQVARE